MSITTTTRTGHRELDHPGFGGSRYHVPNALVIVWLFKAISVDRDDVQRVIMEAGSTHLPENKNRPIGTVPWLRSFEPTSQDIGDMTLAPSILIDRDLLKESKCIISHGLDRSLTQYGVPTMEYASVKLVEVYDLVTQAQWDRSWFPDTLPLTAKLEFPKSTASCQPVVPQIDDIDGIGDFTQDVAIIVTVDLTPTQRAQLLEILDCDLAEAVFLNILNTSPDMDDIEFLMDVFLARQWFLGDFVVIDAQTVAELNAINAEKGKSKSENDSGIENEREHVNYEQGPFPSFLLATSLQMRHRATDSQGIGLDEVGYAVGRRQMLDEEEYSLWCGCVFRGMGLRSFIGDEGWDSCYWSCWLDEKGKGDDELKTLADIRY